MEKLAWIKNLDILKDIENVTRLKKLSAFAENLLVLSVQRFGYDRGLETFIWLYEEFARIPPFKEYDVYVLKAEYIKQSYAGEKISDFQRALPFNCSVGFLVGVLNQKEIFNHTIKS